jgi:hypothetical protein
MCGPRFSNFNTFKASNAYNIAHFQSNSYLCVLGEHKKNLKLEVGISTCRPLCEISNSYGGEYEDYWITGPRSLGIVLTMEAASTSEES